MSRLKTFVLVLSVSFMLSLLTGFLRADDPTWHIDASLGYGTFRQLVWKPDGRFFAVASDASVQIYTPELQVAAIIYEPDAFDIAWQPGGTHMAIATTEGIVIWDISGGDNPSIVREIPPGKPPMAWSPDGQWLAFSDDEAQIWLYKGAAGRSRVAFRKHSFKDVDFAGKPGMYALAWSPDGTQLASSGYRTPVYIWDAQTGDIAVTLQEVSASRLGSIIWRENRRLVILEVGGSSMPVHIIEDGVLVQTQEPDPEPGHSVKAAVLSPDGKYMALWTENHVLQLIDSATLELKASHEPFEPSFDIVQAEEDWSIAWQPDGSTVIAGVTGTVYAWRIENETITLIRSIEDAYAGWLNALDWSPDGTRLASIHGFLNNGGNGNDNRLRVWHTATNRMLWRTDGAGQVVTSLTWSSDGQKIVTGHFMDYAFFRVWDAQTGEHIADAPESGGWGRDATWIPNSERLLITYSGALIMFNLAVEDWQAAGASLYETGNGTHFEAIGGLDISADGELVVSNGYPGQESDVTVWNLTDGTIIATLEQSQVYSDGASGSGWRLTIAFSPDGTQVAVSSGASSFSYGRDVGVETISIYDAMTGERLHLLRGHESGITQLSWSPDGNYLVSSSRDGTARLWDAARGAALSVLVDTGDVLSAAAWSPDGKTIAVGALNGVIYRMRQA